jgi:hypothetical protein
MTDWDFNMGLKDFCSSVHMQEFRRWRLTGIGFETRLATGQIPNNTMASYIPGKKVS